MPSDFTVIQAVRQRFGDSDSDWEWPQERDAPFVGQSKDFPFSCPGVDSSQMAVLQFESFAVGAGSVQIFIPGALRNIIRINGVDIPGGITPGATTPVSTQHYQSFWKSHTLLVPANVLREQNVLHIEAVRFSLTTNQANLDNFIIDNVAVFFKLRSSPGQVPGTVAPRGSTRVTRSKKVPKSAAKKKSRRRRVRAK